MTRTAAFLFAFASCGVRKAELATLEDPGNPEAWEALGDAQRRARHREEALDAYRMAVELDPSRTHLLDRVSGRPSAASRELERQARASPRDDELWGDLGDQLRLDGDVLASRQAYLRAFRIDPLDSEWHRALIELGSGDLVVEIAQSQVIPTDDESLGDWGDLLTTLGRTEEACDAWRRAAELDPYDDEWIGHATECGYPVPEGYSPRDTGYPGGVLGAVGGMVESLAVAETIPEASDLEGLVSRVSSDAGLLVRLGQAYLVAGDREKAEETLWGALLVAHTDEEALQSYLLATAKTRREVLERLRTTFPDDDEVIGLLADHYVDLGMRDRARDLYDLAHSLDADDPEWESKRKLLAARP